MRLTQEIRDYDMNEESLFKIIMTGIMGVGSYFLFLVKKTHNKFTSQGVKIQEHDIKLAVIDEQMKHILDKLEDVVELGKDLKSANTTILRALARKK